MSSGMNAGVMLLEPNQEVYERMVKEIQVFAWNRWIGVVRTKDTRSTSTPLARSALGRDEQSFLKDSQGKIIWRAFLAALAAASGRTCTPSASPSDSLKPIFRFNYQPNLPDDYVGQAHRSIDVARLKSEGLLILNVQVLQDVMVAHYSGGRVGC